ncbi:MAG TPA: glycosyltransferase [Rhodanobacteraceae bacterium]|nr:glycosyltransferase [Rhodanobacteraceae bacterium]
MRDTGDKPFRVCVFGSAIESGLTIAADIGTPFATIGPLRPSIPAAMHIDAPASDDPLELIPFAARAYPRETLILVRADTRLPPFAIERLLRALECVGVLGAAALDDIVPERALPDLVRDDNHHERVDALCFAYGERRLIDASLHRAAFSAWDGERLAQLGHASPADPDALATHGFRCVLLDHLHVHAAVSEHQAKPAIEDPRDPVPPSPLAALRERVSAALRAGATPDCPGLDARPVLLHVLHGWGGGAERWVRDFARTFDAACHLVLVTRGSFQRRRHGEWIELHDAVLHGPPRLRIALPVPIADTALADNAYREILAGIVRDHCVDAVIVSSLIGHSLDVLATRLPTFCVIHDHYPLWPTLHRDFGDATLRFDDTQRARDLAAFGDDAEFPNRDPKHWRTLRDATVSALRAAGATLIAPSRSALSNELRLAPELAELPKHVIAHGLAPWPENAPTPAQVPARKRPRLLVPGRVRRGKGAELLATALSKLREHADLYLVGAGADAHALFGEHGVHIVLDYERDDLPALVARIAPDAALLLPTVAETFSYTLSELRSLGVPVIATRVGALAERIRDGIDGFLVEADAHAVTARVAALLAGRAALDRVRSTAGADSEPTLAEMASAYADVLRLGTRPAARYPLAETDVASLRDAARASTITRLRNAEDSLRTDLSAARAESERRGDWGHALDRDLAERTRWAQSLDTELRDLKPRYEQILGSTSWRITAPLRRANARFAGVRARLAFRTLHVRTMFARVRGSVAQRGISGTLARIWRELRGKGPVRARVTYAPPREDFASFTVPTSNWPRVSIVIPVYNKIDYTSACLRSLGEHAGRIPFEIIVVDDASAQATQQRLEDIDGIRVVRNEVNLGFIGSCNAGAAVAQGELLLFLNNDTRVTPGWLEALVRCLDEAPAAGLVGARLIYPDGRLQEAGGIVFSDASGWNYGRFEDPDDPRYAFRREADYCSGAAILLRTELFRRLGGFDTRYTPAYYEDTDLAFAVRAAGYKVYYEPASTVVHFEGITSGTDTTTGIKRFQPINHAKFLDKWKLALARQPAPGTPITRAASHRAARRVLIVDATTPTPDQDSGSLRMVNLMRVLGDLGCRTTFLPDNRLWDERYTSALQELGVEALYAPWTADPVKLFRERGAEFDAIVLSRHYVAASFVGLARLYAPRAKLIFDTVDLHYLREQRGAAVEGKTELTRHAAATRAQELKLIRECDVTLVVSSAEQELLAADAPGARVEVLSNVHEVFGCRAAFESRRDLVFVGGFQHPPNVDAVTWFVREVFPRVRVALADCKFHVIGSKVPPSILALASEHVIVHGYVEDIAPYMDSCRVSVAPLRYGAGVKGKVNMAMSYGLPVVATPIGIEGMHVEAGDDVLVAGDPEGFSEAVIRVYRDEALWNRLSARGLDNVRRHFSFDAARAAVKRILAL